MILRLIARVLGTSATNWNTAADGSGSQVAWTDGDDAVFSANGTSTISLGAVRSANSITVSGTGYTFDGTDFRYGLNVGAGSSEISAGAVMIHDSWTLGGPLLWSGGDVSVSNFSSVGGGGASNITLDGGSATWTQSGGLVGGGYSDWESGNIAFSGVTYYATYATLEGGSNTWVMDSGSFFSVSYTNWLSGDISVDNHFKINGTYSTMNFEGGDSTFTIAGTYEYAAGTINWTSGNIVLNNAVLESTGSPYTLTVPAGAELDVNGTFSVSNANIVNDGTISWLANSNDALADVTNNGDIVLDGSNPLVTLTGTGSATEGSAYTLNIGSVSGDVDGTVTDYIVDWGDGSGADDFTSAGDQTHTYAGNTTDPTDYTIQVHLITADGAYITAATQDVSVADIAPVVTVDDPGTTTTTPTLTGTAGIAPGDASTVTLNLYSGSTATGTPIDTETVDVDPDTGEFAYTVDPSSPLAAGTYTFQTTQDEEAGNTGTSDPQTFTVTLQDPAAPTSLTATPASPTEIDLSWDSAPASDFITTYSIYYSTDYGQTFTYYANTADGAATGMNITGLDPQTAYEFNVVANNASGSSPDEITPATSPLVDIEPPTNLAYTLIDGGLNGVNLTWTNNSVGQTAYQVEAKWAGTGQFVEIANLAATATSYTYTDEANDDWATEPITFRVRAVGVGQSAYSADPDDVTATATFPDTGSVTDLAITSIDTSGVHFTFSQSGITEYDIIYRKQGATPGDYGTWRSYEITDNGGNDFSDPTIADTIQLPYLAWTDGVQLAVQAGGEGEGGPITNIVTASVPTMGLDAPTLTASVDSANSQIDLSWTSAGGDGVHSVTYSVLDMTPASDSIYIGPHLVTVTTDTSAVISLPEYGGYYAILATDTLGDTAMSSTTDLAIAKTPTGLSAINTLDEDGNPVVSLTWDNNSYNETGYEIQRSTSSTDWDSDHDLQTFTDIDTDQGNYVDTTALADTTYYYRIQATRPDYVSTIDDEPVSTSLSSDYTMPVSLTTAPPTIRITMDGLDHSENLTTGGFVLLNADDDNGSAMQSNDTPTTLDLDATHLANDDPDLKKVTIDLTGAKIGDKVEIGWVDNETGFGPGSGSIALWQDQRKNNSQGSVVTIDATNQNQIVFYVEGNDLSRTLNDITITATVEQADGTPYQLDDNNVNDELNLTVGPILTDMSITHGRDDSNPTYIDNSDEGPPQIGYISGGYINGKIQKEPGLDTSGLGIIQTLQISNNIIFNDQVAGAAISPIGSMPIGSTYLYTWDFSPPYDSSTLVDALPVTNPDAASTFPFFNSPIPISNEDVYWIFNKDQPLLYVNSVLPPKGSQTFIDVTYNFTDYLVMQYQDTNKSILVLAEDTWSVRFQGTLINRGFMTFVPGSDNGAIFGTYTATNTPIPIPLTRPVSDDASPSWI